jgi:hypothetical protein
MPTLQEQKSAGNIPYAFASLDLPGAPQTAMDGGNADFAWSKNLPRRS